MAFEDRRESRHLALIQALTEAPHSFDFYRAVRELECAFDELPRIGESRSPQMDAVRFGQDPSLAFAPAALSGFVPSTEGKPHRLVQSFFGLLGPNGPLPLHLSEYARDRMLNARDHTLIRFLDLFHHRLLSLFYRAWARAQPTVSLDRPDRDQFTLYMGAFVGLCFASMRRRDSVPDSSKLSFAGLLGRQVRNAEGLGSILSGFLRVPVEVQSLVPHWMSLPEEICTRLGNRESCILGETAVAGGRVWDLQTRFRVVIGPLSIEQYHRLLPGSSRYKRLRDWVRNYVGFEFKWDCRLLLKSEDVQVMRLGHFGELGWTTWLGVRLTDDPAGDLLLSPVDD